MQVVFPVVEKTLATGVTLPSEMISAANQLARARQTGPHGDSVPVTLEVLSEPAGSVAVSGGLRLQSGGSWSGMKGADWIILPPLWGNPLPMLARHPALTAALAERIDQGASLVATGTAVCFAAESGRLRGRAATTHWSWFDRFERRYPDVLLRTRQTITRDGDIYCAASVNALSDLVLYLIRTWFGPDIMGVIERQFSHEVRRSIAQPYYWLGGMQHDDEDIVRAQAWLMEHLSGRFSLSRLASAVGLSERTLSRRFSRATGSSPKQYWLQLRLLRAEELLKESNLSIQEIGAILGFSDASHFVHAFRRKAGVTPNRYREVARAKQFSVETGSAQ